MIKRSLQRIAQGIALAAALAAASPTSAADAGDDFLAAREAFRSADARRLDFYASRLQNYVLEPYVSFWRLRLRLDEASPTEVRRFLSSYAETPLASRLLSDWLKALGRTQQWEIFDAEYGRYSGDDLDVTCYAIQSKARTQPETLAEARALWFVPRDLPENCNPLFNVLVQDQKITTEDIWSRVRIALEAGQVSMAQRAAAYLPPGQQPDARSLTLISTNPGGYLERQNFDLKSRGGREAVMFAVYRLARTSSQQAAGHWVRLENRFGPD
ncbi:MAG: hypothetical protein ACXWC3_11390, partial [Burkholderiales bacterium]